MNNEWPTDFAEFCRQCIALGAEIRMVPRIDGDTGGVVIYAHPLGKNGASVDYRVRGDELRRIDNRPVPAGRSEHP